MSQFRFQYLSGRLALAFPPPYRTASSPCALWLLVLLHVQPWGHAGEKTPAPTPHLLRTTLEEPLLFVIMRCVGKGRLGRRGESGQMGSSAAAARAGVGGCRLQPPGRLCLPHALAESFRTTRSIPPQLKASSSSTGCSLHSSFEAQRPGLRREAREGHPDRIPAQLLQELFWHGVC